MATADYLLTPGMEIPIEVLADSNGTVAREGDGVHLRGENSDAVEVELVESVSDRCVGLLADDPKDFEDPDVEQADFSSGDSAGMATLILGSPVVFMATDSGFSPSVGDFCEVGDGGDIEDYQGPTASGLGGAVTNNIGVDGSGNLETDNGSDIDLNFTGDAFPFGQVFSTIAREWGVGDRTAVIKFGAQ